ncbi:MAG: hypothetical protein ACLRSW_09410 [Christensenellaceae bacterium]
MGRLYDEGGDGSIDENNQALYEDFEEWYKEQAEIRVEYIRVHDNETLYNQWKRGQIRPYSLRNI